ncbi:MAG: hypothetical protein IT488_01200 [Gammaproteobacteria bacterium]|nr:hypothetical protein [Gammaproteobacteria bacterium]
MLTIAKQHFRPDQLIGIEPLPSAALGVFILQLLCNSTESRLLAIIQVPHEQTFEGKLDKDDHAPRHQAYGEEQNQKEFVSDRKIHTPSRGSKGTMIARKSYT